MTAVRPGDYGDQYPSDSGDVIPPNPTDGFAELDYRVNRYIPRQSHVRPGVKGSPNLNVESRKPTPKEVFNAIVVKREGTDIFTILRQDGRRDIAYVRGNDALYDDFAIGDSVILAAGQIPGTWVMTGSNRRKEMASIRVTNNADCGPVTQPTLLKFDSIINETGLTVEGDEEVNKNFELKNGGVIIKNDGLAHYELSIVVPVEYIGEGPSAGTTRVLITDSSGGGLRFFGNKLQGYFGEVKLPIFNPMWIDIGDATDCPP